MSPVEIDLRKTYCRTVLALGVLGAMLPACHGLNPTRQTPGGGADSSTEDSSGGLDRADGSTTQQDAAKASPADAGVTPDLSMPDSDANNIWQPALATSWDWQLATPIDPTVNAEMFEIDAFDNDASVVADLHTRGKKVLCYVDLGSWEDFRPDVSLFPASVLGVRYIGYPNERWLDIRQIDLLTPVVRSRLDMARAKGCDGIEADNADGFNTNTHESSGFPLTYADQLKYNRFVASECHARGMAVALKNDLEQVKDLVGDYDMAVSEQCFQYQACDYLVPFTRAGKPVFEAEYELKKSAFCPDAIKRNINSILKTPRLDSSVREACR